MSDLGDCSSNLDRLLEMHNEHPLSAREIEIALMQFDYVGTNGILEDFRDHPIVKILHA